MWMVNFPEAKVMWLSSSFTTPVFLSTVKLCTVPLNRMHLLALWIDHVSCNEEMPKLRCPYSIFAFVPCSLFADEYTDVQRGSREGLIQSQFWAVTLVSLLGLCTQTLKWQNLTAFVNRDEIELFHALSFQFCTTRSRAPRRTGSPRVPVLSRKPRPQHRRCWKKGFD